MAENYISIKVILDKILRHPLLQDVSLETVVDYTVDFMRIVGVPKMFETETVVLEVADYRTLLPSNYHQVIQIRDKKTKVPYEVSTSSFTDADEKFLHAQTYKISGDIIYTSQKECEIEMTYRTIAVDEDGYPLLPDSSSFTRALEGYIKMSWFTILFDLGKIHATVLNNAQTDYAWAVGDCESEFHRMSIDEAEAFYNSWRTFIMRDREHSNNFRSLGAKEYIKLQ